MRIKRILNIWRIMIASLLLALCKDQIKHEIIQDAEAYIPSERGILAFSDALLVKSFRNILYYRVRQEKSVVLRILSILTKIVLPPLDSVEITGGKILGGLYITHNHCVLHVGVAGKNLKIGPGVIIGKNNNGWPNIGDNVYVAAHATIIGSVNIGNNAIIGAGAMVVKDVEENSVVIGNPARKIRNIDMRKKNDVR